MEVIWGAELKKYNRLYRKMDEFYHNIAVKTGLSDSVFWILYAICEYGDGCLQRDICAAFCVSKQTIHSAIHRMEKDGYLYLTEGRGRDKHIYLTKEGQRLMEENIVPVVRRENEALAKMGKENSKELLRLTERYMQFLLGR